MMQTIHILACMLSTDATVVMRPLQRIRLSQTILIYSYKYSYYTSRFCQIVDVYTSTHHIVILKTRLIVGVTRGCGFGLCGHISFKPTFIAC